MSATYTFDVFSSLDGYGSYSDDGDWGEGYRRFWEGSFDRLEGYLRELHRGKEGDDERR